MEKQPWDLPVTAEGREVLIKLAEQYQAEGKNREFAWTAVRLARTLKWTGSGRDDVDWSSWAQRLAEESVRIFREIDDKLGLATALRAAVPQFAQTALREELLQEPLEISTEIGDESGQGWAYFALGNVGGDPENLNRAWACFEAVGEKGGMAAVRVRQGAQTRQGPPIREGAELYLEAGNPKEAYRSFIMATMFGREQMSFEEREQIMLRALRLTQEHEWPSDQYLVFRNLANLMKDAKRPEDRKRYLAEARKLKQFAPKFKD